tara:strand:+ start:461 stop:670 length:210 start_codon:yes stop_codon:yes gene_type:complete
MKRRNIIVFGSIVVFIPAIYHGMIVLSGFAVAAFFYELGKMSGTIDRSLRLRNIDSVSARNPSVISDDG